MSDFVKVCKESDVPEGKGRLVIVDGKRIALFKDNGKVFAMQDACPHKGSSLSGGFVEDGMAVCPEHGWHFMLDSGQAEMFPMYKARTYQVKVEKGDVFVKV